METNENEVGTGFETETVIIGRGERTLVIGRGVAMTLFNLRLNEERRAIGTMPNLEIKIVEVERCVPTTFSRLKANLYATVF